MGASRVKDLPRAVAQSKHTLAAARWPSLLVPETKWLDQWAAAAAVCMIFARFSAHRPRHIYRCFNRPRRLIGLRTATHFAHESFHRDVLRFRTVSVASSCWAVEHERFLERCIGIPYCFAWAARVG